MDVNKEVDRDYLGIEDLVKEGLQQKEIDQEKGLKRGKEVQFTTDTPGWTRVIEPYLRSKTAMKAIDPRKEGWEREYIAQYAIVTVATEILGLISNWIVQAEQIKENKDA